MESANNEDSLEIGIMWDAVTENELQSVLSGTGLGPAAVLEGLTQHKARAELRMSTSPWFRIICRVLGKIVEPYTPPTAPNVRIYLLLTNTAW